MIKKLIIGLVLLVAGYIIGVHAGVKASVHDYIHNNAEMLKSMSDIDFEKQPVRVSKESDEESAESSESSPTFQ